MAPPNKIPDTIALLPFGLVGEVAKLFADPEDHVEQPHDFAILSKKDLQRLHGDLRTRFATWLGLAKGTSNAALFNAAKHYSLVHFVKQFGTEGASISPFLYQQLSHCMRDPSAFLTAVVQSPDSDIGRLAQEYWGSNTAASCDKLSFAKAMERNFAVVFATFAGLEVPPARWLDLITKGTTDTLSNHHEFLAPASASPIEQLAFAKIAALMKTGAEGDLIALLNQTTHPALQTHLLMALWKRSPEAVTRYLATPELRLDRHGSVDPAAGFLQQLYFVAPVDLFRRVLRARLHLWIDSHYSTKLVIYAARYLGERLTEGDGRLDADAQHLLLRTIAWMTPGKEREALLAQVYGRLTLDERRALVTMAQHEKDLRLSHFQLLPHEERLAFLRTVPPVERINLYSSLSGYTETFSWDEVLTLAIPLSEAIGAVGPLLTPADQEEIYSQIREACHSLVESLIAVPTQPMVGGKPGLVGLRNTQNQDLAVAVKPLLAILADGRLIGPYQQRAFDSTERLEVTYEALTRQLRSAQRNCGGACRVDTFDIMLQHLHTLIGALDHTRAIAYGDSVRMTIVIHTLASVINDELRSIPIDPALTHLEVFQSLQHSYADTFAHAPILQAIYVNDLKQLSKKSANY